MSIDMVIMWTGATAVTGHIINPRTPSSHTMAGAAHVIRRIGHDANMDRIAVTCFGVTAAPGMMQRTKDVLDSSEREGFLAHVAFKISLCYPIFVLFAAFECEGWIPGEFTRFFQGGTEGAIAPKTLR